MKNEKGLTLIELIGVLALLGMVVVLATSIFVNGLNASERNTTNQRLQQESNYILSVIRNTYLENESEPFTVRIEGNGDAQKLFVSNELVSEGYGYELTVTNNNCPVSLPELHLSVDADCLVLKNFLTSLYGPSGTLTAGTFIVMRTISPEVEFTISSSDKEFNVVTSLSKLN